MTTEDINAVLNGLEFSCLSLTNLSLDCCDISEDTCFIIGNFLSKCPNLKVLRMSQNPGIGIGILYILNGLLSCKNVITVIHFMHCKFQENIKEGLGKFILEFNTVPIISFVSTPSEKLLNNILNNKSNDGRTSLDIGYFSDNNTYFYLCNQFNLNTNNMEK